MLSVFILLASLAALYTKGQFMEGRIDKIDVKRNRKELIALYYRMELKAFIQVLLYNTSVSKLSIKS